MAQNTGCDLHIPFKTVESLDPENPGSQATHLSENMFRIERWASHFYRSCLPSAACLPSGAWVFSEDFAVGNDVSPVEVIEADWTEVWADPAVFQTIPGSSSFGQMFLAQPGVYLISGQVAWESNPTGERSQWFVASGSGGTTLGGMQGHTAQAPPGFHPPISDDIDAFPLASMLLTTTEEWGMNLAAGQTSGGSLNILGVTGAVGTQATYINVVRLCGVPIDFGGGGGGGGGGGPM